MVSSILPVDIMTKEYCCEIEGCKYFSKKHCWEDNITNTIGTECIRTPKLIAEEVGLIPIPYLGFIYILEEMHL